MTVMTDACVTVEMILKEMSLLKEVPAVTTLCLPESQRNVFGKIRTWLVEGNPQLA